MMMKILSGPIRIKVDNDNRNIKDVDDDGNDYND